MFGKRAIKNYGKFVIFDEDNRLFLSLNMGKHKGITEFCKFYNGIEGKLVKIKPKAVSQDLSDMKILK
jgi:hypothetical protein